jgi:uncharacterized protein (TIGR02246 family)
MKRFTCLAALALSLLLNHASYAAEAGSAEAVVQRQLDAYNARDIEAFLATYSDDVALFDFPASPRSKGKDAMRARYGRLFGNQSLRATVTQRIVMGNTVIDHENVQLTVPQGPATIDAVAIYEVKDGKIATVTFIMGAQTLNGVVQSKP